MSGSSRRAKKAESMFLVWDGLLRMTEDEVLLRKVREVVAAKER